MSTRRVLVVARPTIDTEYLISRLREASCLVEFALTAEGSLELLTRFAPDIVVIDEEILGGTPIELILRMRAEVSAERAPVFMVAVQSEAANSSSDLLDRSQPAVFNGVARIADQIAGLMNSSQHSDAEPEQIHCHGLSLDRARHCGSVAGNVLRLTPTEFKLLWKLASRPGYVLSRNELTKLCKGADGATAIQARTIDAHIKSIRRKLLERSRLIETVHGVGYRFQETSAVVG